MTRIVLLLALVAVGYDAYAHQGYYTRATVGQVETGIQRLSATVNDGRTETAPTLAQPSPNPAP